MPGAFKLDHLQPFKSILFRKFLSCVIFILGGQFLLPQRANNEKRRISELQKNETEWFQCLEHSNWTIYNSLSPFCSRNFPFVSSLYWEASPYYPRGLIMRKGKSSDSERMRQNGYSAWCIQIRLFTTL